MSTLLKATNKFFHQSNKLFYTFCVIQHYALLLWRIDPLLGNDSANTFPREPRSATIGRLLLGNRSVNTSKTIRDNRRFCFPWGAPRGYITKSSKWSLVVVRSWESSVEEEFIWVSCRQDDSRRWLWKEDFMCDLKWQWDCYKSVARIRLVKTEKPSACVTVNWKVCRSAIALYCM
jgi:hypothetical protein